MDKRQWLSHIKRVAANLLAAIAIACVLQYFFHDQYEKPDWGQTVIAGMLIYLAVACCLWAVNAIGGVLYLGLFKADDLTACVLADLRSLNIPPPKTWQSKRIDYLLEMANDPGVEANDRIRAATLFATFNTITKRAGFFGSIAWQAAADNAVLRYSEEAPQK